MSIRSGRIPLLLKICYTIFMMILVPVWWVHYGPKNFLWFSDIALLTMLVALWLENRLLASMMALAVVIPELAWNLDFIFWIFTRSSFIGLTGYLKEQETPLYVRSLSVGFHIFLPWLILWTVHRLGYNPRALPAQIALAWMVLPVSFAVSPRQENINWVFGFGDRVQHWIPQAGWVALEMIIFPLVFYLPVHLALRWWRGPSHHS
jgi:hypothetical protein